MNKLFVGQKMKVFFSYNLEFRIERKCNFKKSPLSFAVFFAFLATTSEVLSKAQSTVVSLIVRTFRRNKGKDNAALTC